MHSADVKAHTIHGILYLYSPKVVQKRVQPCKDQIWMKRPLHNWCGAFEILCQFSSMDVVGVLVGLAHFQCVLYLLQTFLTLCMKDLFSDVATGLKQKW